VTAWEQVRARAAVEPDVLAIVEVTLLHAMDEVRRATPASTSMMTFEGGKRRAVSILRGLRRDARAAWTGGA
jgi:hypothetical protein